MMTNKREPITKPPTVRAGQAIIIPGEAPETDDEADHGDGQNFASTSANLPTKRQSQQRSNAAQKASKHDSILHNKLRDAQINLAVDAADFSGRTTTKMNVEVQRVAQSVYASQITLQEAACHIRSVAEDLYKIDDKLDAIFDSHSLIPADLANAEEFPTIKKYSKAAK